MAEIVLGRKYRDRISGVEGTATARTVFLYGCVRILLEGGIKDDGTPKEVWVDEQRLVTDSKARLGGPGAAPPRRDCPRR